MCLIPRAGGGWPTPSLGSTRGFSKAGSWVLPGVGKGRPGPLAHPSVFGFVFAVAGARTVALKVKPAAKRF